MKDDILEDTINERYLDRLEDEFSDNLEELEIIEDTIRYKIDDEE